MAKKKSKSPKKSYAGFWKRFVAVVIDAILIGVIVAFLSIFINVIFSDTFGSVLTFVLEVGGFWYYYAKMESSGKQATLGKQALGIKVVDINMKKVSFGRATGRHFAKYVSAVIFGIGFLMIAFTKKKQGLHDKIAETLVVNN